MSSLQRGGDKPKAAFNLTFRQWLLKQSKREDKVGDIARDVQADPNFPHGRLTTKAKTIKKTCREYLESHYTSDAVQGALSAAIDEYCRLRDASLKRSETTRKNATKTGQKDEGNR